MIMRRRRRVVGCDNLEIFCNLLKATGKVIGKAYEEDEEGWMVMMTSGGAR